LTGVDVLVEAARMGGYEEREWTYRRKDGDRITVNLVVTAVRGPNGKLTGFLGIAKDITALKQATLQAEAQQELLSAISDVQKACISDLRADEMFAKLLARLQILTRSPSGIVGEAEFPGDAPPSLRIHAHTIATAPGAAPDRQDKTLQRYLNRIFTTGQPVLVNDSSHSSFQAFLGLPLLDGDKVIGAVAVAGRPEGYHASLIDYLNPFLQTCGQILRSYRNTMQRQTAERALTRHTAWLRAILDHATDGIITIDECGTVTSFNPAAERIFDYTASDMIQTNVSRLMPEPHQSAHDSYLQHYRQTGQARPISSAKNWKSPASGKTAPCFRSNSPSAKSGSPTAGSLPDSSAISPRARNRKRPYGSPPDISNRKTASSRRRAIKPWPPPRPRAPSSPP
jgi:PAS domain S-box-containing protein